MTSTPEKKGTTAKAPSQARLFRGDELIGLITSITVEDMFK